MITQENFKEIVNAVGEKRLLSVLDNRKEYCLLEVFVNNSGFKTSLTSRVYSRKVEKYARDNGQVFIDKENFALLLKNYGVLDYNG